MSNGPFDKAVQDYYTHEHEQLNALPDTELQKLVEWRTKAPGLLRLFRSSLFFYPNMAEKSYTAEGILKKRHERETPPIRRTSCHDLGPY